MFKIKDFIEDVYSLSVLWLIVIFTVELPIEIFGMFWGQTFTITCIIIFSIVKNIKYPNKKC